MNGKHRDPDPPGFNAWADNTSVRREGVAHAAKPSSHIGTLALARRRAVIAVALGAVLLVVLAGGAYALISRGPCGGRVGLTIVASPDIAPVLTELARKYAEGDDCSAVSIVARSSSDTADQLAAGKNIPDVWIPEASVWTDLARVQGADRALFTSSTSIARSPVIMAAGQGTADKLAVGGEQPSWTLLVPSSRNKKRLPNAVTGLLAPSRFASGLAGLNSLNAVVARRPALLRIVEGITVNLKRSVLPSEEALFRLIEKPRGGEDPVVVDSEQAVWHYNDTHLDRRAIGLYPREGTLALDYPYVPLSKDAAKRQAAEEFQRAVAGPAGRTLLQAGGFRAPDGKAGPAMDGRHGVRAEPPVDIPAPDIRTTVRSLLSMKLLLADTRTLLLLDVGASMAEKIPGARTTRMEATAKFAEAGVRLLPAGSDVGLWVFSTKLNGGDDYKQVVPVGPVAQRGPEVVRGLRELPGHTRGGGGLYDSVLAAFRSASKQQVKGKLNSVIVFTDGGNDDPGGISLDDLITTLQKEFQAAQPVTVTLIGYGEGLDPEPLRQIADVTNGVSMIARTFEQAQQIFLQVMADRVCVVREKCDSQQG